MKSTVISRLIDTQLTYNGVVMIDIKIVYPRVAVADDPAGSARISCFYERRADAYYDFASGRLYRDAVKDYRFRMREGAPFNPYTAMSTYLVPYNGDQFLSIVYDLYEYTGGAHGNTTRHADTWALPGGCRMKLGEFFSGPGYKRILFSGIFTQINAQIAQGQDIYFDDYQKNVFKYFDEQNFYLTPEGFAIFYPLYSIAPYSSGILTFVIPYEAFGDLLQNKP